MLLIRSWKTRFATISKTCLAYYDSDEAAEKGLSAAKGGVLFAGASVEVFDAENDQKRGHQFFITGKTIDGSYSGSRDLVMCAQSPQEFDEWDRLLKLMIGRANGGDGGPAENAAAEQKFRVAVRSAVHGAAEPHIVECDTDSKVENVIDDYLRSRGGEWPGGKESVVIQRHALCEALAHDEWLIDYNFVRARVALEEHPTIELTLAARAPKPADSVVEGAEVQLSADDVRFRLADLHWLRGHNKPATGLDRQAGGQPNDATIDEILNTSLREPLLQPISAANKRKIWSCREQLGRHPQMLGSLLQAVPSWDAPGAVKDVFHLLETVARPCPQEAMQLLDPRFWRAAGLTRDPGSLDYIASSLACREYAVQCLVHMPDQELNLYMLQLSQLIKLEENLTESPLAALLMYRSLRNPFLIGQALYWGLRSELYEASVCTHMSYFLRQYLDNCGAHRAELRNQEELMIQLKNTIKHIKMERERRKQCGEDYSIQALRQVLQSDLEKIKMPVEGVRMPVNPNLRCKALVVESCKVLGSHQVPLWLVFTNMDPTAGHICVIFKDGDDVRQDALVLQLFNIMQGIWQENGVDIPLRPEAPGAYGCTSLGYEVGLIEVVMNCNTLAGIVKEQRGGSALGVFDPKIYYDWLRDKNPTPSEWHSAVDKFIRSCAGYCVATYILGVADRHNDNVMLAQTGELVHIDFGHFLGHVSRV